MAGFNAPGAFLVSPVQLNPFPVKPVLQIQTNGPTQYDHTLSANQCLVSILLFFSINLLAFYH